MKLKLFAALIACSFIYACEVKTKVGPSPVVGTWKLVKGTLIEEGDTTVTDYTGSREMIKILNNTHFSFLNHDKKDTSAFFIAGGGKYKYSDGDYTEYLDYCSDRQWEGHEFNFQIEIEGDTLVQTGTEVVEKLGVNRLNIEKYIRISE
jgi:hypothetical protein